MTPTPAPPRPAAPINPRLSHLALGLLILVLSVHLLETFATVLQQLFAAVFIGYLILPMHHALVRRGLPLIVSAAFIIAGTVLAIVGLGSLIYDSVNDLTNKVPVYQRNLSLMLREVEAQIPGLDLQLVLRTIRGDVLEGGGLRLVRSALGNLVGFFSNAVVVIIYLCFLLAESSGFGRRMIKAFGPERTPQVLAVVSRINTSVMQYLRVKTLMGVLAGGLTAAVLWLFGVDYAMLWGVLALLLNYIPILGSLVAVALPVLLSLVQFVDPSDPLNPWRTLVILGCLLVVQNVIAYVVEPRVAGRTLDLSPLVILLALAFWGALWGIIGMILAVPLVVVVKTVMENVEATRPIAALLSNV